MDTAQFLRGPECWTISGMRGWTVVVLIGAFAGACSGTESSAGGATPPSAAGAGMSGSTGDGGSQAGASTAHIEPTGGTGGKQVETPAAGKSSDGGSGGLMEATGTAGTTPAAGSHAPAGGQGGAAVGGSGGMPSGGNSAPAERVLWSQDWTVSIHDPVTQPGFKDASMGLALDAGEDCRFGFSGAASGSTQTFPTDGTCITAAGSLVSGVAIVFDSAGTHSGATAGRAPLSGWSAVNGHTVKYLRRTQTYTVQLLGSGDTSFNYADFTGKWEAVGY